MYKHKQALSKCGLIMKRLLYALFYLYSLLYWEVLHAFSLSADFFSKSIEVSKNLDPDQARQNVGHFVRPDLGPNC